MKNNPGSQTAKKLLAELRRHRESIQQADSRMRRTLASGGNVRATISPLGRFSFRKAK